MRITLSYAEFHMCDVFGTMRRRTAMNNNINDQQMGKQDSFTIDIEGMVGEYAVAKALNLCPDFTVGPRNGGHDLLTHNNKTVDIKTTKYKTGALLATLKKEQSPCDIYVLVTVDKDGCDIAGWASSEELFQSKNIKDKGHGPGFCLEQDQLNKDIYEINKQV